MADVMNQAGQNQGITFDQMKSIMQQNKKPWGQQHPWQMAGAGTGAAALSGLLSGLFSGGGMFGKKERTDQVPLFSPEIMKLKNQMPLEIWQQLMGNQFDFGPIENLARQGFEQKTIPSIMSRFNMGSNLNSSAQMGALGEAGTNLDAQLAAMRQNYGQERQRLLASLFPTAMSPSFENVGRPRQQGGLEQGGNAIMTMLPYLIKAAAMAA